MARWLTILCLAAVAVVAFTFSLLNPTAARLDLGTWTPELPLGVLVLVAVLLGALLGGAVLYFGVILPLRMRLRRAQRELAGTRSEQSIGHDVEDAALHLRELSDWNHVEVEHVDQQVDGSHHRRSEQQ